MIRSKMIPSRMLRNLKALPALLSLVILLLSSIAFGQGGAATGDLHVTVKDPKGDLVVNATVTVKDVAKGLERTATGDGQGGYSVRLLPPGAYTVTVEAPSFGKAEAKDVSITVGGLVDLPVALALASGREVVEVTSQADLVETSRTSTTDTIGQRRIDNLPINGRNYINFTLTDSQVVRDNAPNTGAAPTSGLNMSGQRARSNLVNVDGADATDNSVNGVRSTVSQEAVQEFQIVTNSYAAEYGRAAGGVVNIITRSGSNNFHGDIFGFLRNRNFQAVNPFSTVPNPAYTRVQAGAAFGGPIKKDKTYFYFAYEITRRHETGFSSIGQGNFGLVPFDASPFFGAPNGTFDIQVTPAQASFIADPATPLALAQQYAILAGASSGVALTGQYPASFIDLVGLGILPTPASGNPLAQFITTCQTTGPICGGIPGSFQTLNSQMGNYPVFEGTSVYSLRLDHNISGNNRLMLRANVSPSTITGIEVGGQDQPFGQNAYSRTSEQTFRDVAGTLQDTWTLGNNRVNEFRFQYARRGLAYFYNTKIPGGSDPAVNIPGYAYFGREPYSYIQRTEQRYQFTDNYSWTIGRHDTKFGVDVNYIPISAIFTVNYGGVIDIGSLSAATLGLPAGPGLSAVQAYGAGIPSDFIQGLGSPSDSFHNIPIGVFWQDSWRVNHNVTLNYGLRYDIEIPPALKPITSPLARAAYTSLGLQKGIQTATHNFQPRFGVAIDPKGDGKTVLRASYGIFFDHPLLGLYFLGDASDGSSSGQLAFGPGSPCQGAGNPGNLNAVEIFQGLIPSASGSSSSPCSPTAGPAGPGVLSLLNYSPNQQRFSCPSSDTSCGVASTSQSIFLNQNYLNPTTFLPLGFQPFGYPQSRNFVYAYAQQVNLSVERDLGGGFALSLAYNFNGGRHLNRPINANTIRGDLMVANFNAALAAGATPTPASPFTVSGCGVTGTGTPYVDASLMNFFRPGGLNPSIAAFYLNEVPGGAACVGLAQSILGGLAKQGFNANCDPTTFANCVPFGDMDANYSNGNSSYNGLTANLRKRFGKHYEFLASYTYSHAIDDSTDLQSTLTPQDSYYPAADRATSLFDQRHRFVFSGVYQTGHMSGNFAHRFWGDWTFAPLVEVASGRPFNIITGNDDNFQLSSLTGRPNTVVNPVCTAAGNLPVASKFSPTGQFQEPCIQPFVLTGTTPTLLQLDGNLGRNAGVAPWTIFDDLRVAKRIYFGERYNMELIADTFNIANKNNVAAVSPLFTNAGQATSAYDPRQFQFALKFNW
jgi:Carboxypeptidase regulatory-like domain